MSKTPYINVMLKHPLFYRIKGVMYSSMLLLLLSSFSVVSYGIQPVKQDLFVESNDTEQQVYPITLSSKKQSHCDVKIIGHTGSSLTIAFSGLPANQPKTYQNFIAVWEASVIPWTIAPLKKINLEVNSESGTHTIQNITINKNTYIVGYGVGQEIGTITASSVLAPETKEKKRPTRFVTIGIEDMGATSIAVRYKTLSGYLPKANGNWVGLWKGYVSPYNLPPVPIKKATIEAYSNEGIIALNDVTLGRDTVYTLIYFMGESPTTAATLLTFNTNDPMLISED